MSDFKAKMHENRFSLGFCPKPCWGSLQRFSNPVAGLKGAYFYADEGDGVEGQREGKEDHVPDCQSEKVATLEVDHRVSNKL